MEKLVCLLAMVQVIFSAAGAHSMVPEPMALPSRIDHLEFTRKFVELSSFRRDWFRFQALQPIRI